MKVTFKTSEGNSPKEPFEMEVLIPTGVDVEHLNGGTPTTNPRIEQQNNGSGVGASAVLKITLQPVSVNFSQISIVERDGGSVPPGCSLDEGHKGNGVDELASINDQNAFSDDISGGVDFNELEENGGTHKLPQIWEWVSSWHVHECKETNCPGDSPLENEDTQNDLPSPSVPHSKVGDTIKFADSRQKFTIIRKIIQGKSVIYVEISKFGYTVSRSQGDNQNTYH